MTRRPSTGFTNYLGGLVLLCCATSAPAAEPLLQLEVFRVGSDAGIELQLSNKHAAGGSKHPGERIVLFVHGATFPASSTFDVELPGGTWMGHLAVNGYDVYALDIRGYGGSTRPASMSQPPEANAPFAGVREAVRDIGAAVDYILARRRVSQLALIGWSWGTTTSAAFAAGNPAKVGKLVLVSPVWLGVQPPVYQGAYRTSNHDAARAFALRGMPKERIDEIAPLATFDAWWAATLATDPDGARQSPPVVRAPNGALEDLAKYWAAGKPTYQPADIRAPTLLVVGEWDAITPPAMALDLNGALVNARERRLVIMSEATHFMAIEKHRMRLIREVQNFLDESLD